MFIILSHSNPNRIEINDSSPYTLLKGKKYFLRVTTGKNTVRAFFLLYFSNPLEDIYISTFNLEYFLFKIRRLRNLKIKRLGDSSVEGSVESSVDKYKRIEDSIRKSNTKESNTLCTHTYSSSPYSPPSPLTLSFSPNLFFSLKSSLLSPSLYFSKDSSSSKIFKELHSSKLSYEDLRERVGEVDTVLKSLLFTKIVIKTGEEYEINPLLHA